MNEKEYIKYLASERHMYAWCLVRYGGMSNAEAESEALDRYPYESPDTDYRGIIFHDEAWHWAMLRLFGEGYWLPHPELVCQSREYQEETQKIDE